MKRRELGRAPGGRVPGRFSGGSSGRIACDACSGGAATAAGTIAVPLRYKCSIAQTFGLGHFTRHAHES